MYINLKSVHLILQIVPIQFNFNSVLFDYAVSCLKPGYKINGPLALPVSFKGWDMNDRFFKARHPELCRSKESIFPWKAIKIAQVNLVPQSPQPLKLAENKWLWIVYRKNTSVRRRRSFPPSASSPMKHFCMSEHSLLGIENRQHLKFLGIGVTLECF
jgi:hypothetical protein